MRFWVYDDEGVLFRKFHERHEAEKAGIAALDTQDTVPKKLVALQQRTDPAPFDPEHSLSTLSFAQVMALYKKIKTMLGEA